MDQIRLHRGQRIGVDAQLFLAGGDLVGRNHVRAAHQRMQGGQPVGRRDIERHAALVAIHRDEPERFAVEKRGAPGARIVTARSAFDLDDIGAVVGEQQTCIRACNRGRQIEHANAGEKRRRPGQSIDRCLDRQTIGRIHCGKRSITSRRPSRHSRTAVRGTNGSWKRTRHSVAPSVVR